MAPLYISTVIVSYNVCSLLRRCLASLPQGADIVVVDNASTDGSAAMVVHDFPHVRCLALPDNRGFSAAVNLGAAQVRGEAILLLNPDTEVPEGAMVRMAAALQASADTAAVGFRQVDARGMFQLAVGPRPSLCGELVRRWIQRRLDRGAPQLGRGLDWLLRRRRAVPWVAGSSLLVWRQAFMAIGGFDAGYFLYFEDIDFCLRLQAAGARVYYDPRVTIVHHRGASAAGARGTATRAYRASQVRFWRTHRGFIWGKLMAGYAAYRQFSDRANV